MEMRGLARQLVVITVAASAVFVVDHTANAAAAGACTTRSIEVNNSTVAEGGLATGGTLKFNVTSTGCAAASVSFQTLPGSPGKPPAIAGVDYNGAAGQLHWADGDTSVRTVSVSINGDATTEQDETLTFMLLGPIGLTIDDDLGVGTIADDDYTLTADSEPYCVELCVSCRLRVETTGPLPNAVSLTFATVNGTAVAGADFVGVTGTVTIPAGATSAQFSIMILDDLVPEPTQVFTVVLIKASGIVVPLDTATVTIVDND